MLLQKCLRKYVTVNCFICVSSPKTNFLISISFSSLVVVMFLVHFKIPGAISHIYFHRNLTITTLASTPSSTHHQLRMTSTRVRDNNLFHQQGVELFVRILYVQPRQPTIPTLSFNHSLTLYHSVYQSSCSCSCSHSSISCNSLNAYSSHSFSNYQLRVTRPLSLLLQLLFRRDLFIY